MWLHLHSCRAIIDLLNQCGSSPPGSPLYALTPLVSSSSQNHSFSRIPFGCYESCGISLHQEYVNFDMYLEAVIERVRRFTWMLRSSEPTSAKSKMIQMSQLNNSAILNCYSDSSRCSQMLPDRVNAKQCALWCFESTFRLSSTLLMQQKRM